MLEWVLCIFTLCTLFAITARICGWQFAKGKLSYYANYKDMKNAGKKTKKK